MQFVGGISQGKKGIIQRENCSGKYTISVSLNTSCQGKFHKPLVNI